MPRSLTLLTVCLCAVFGPGARRVDAAPQAFVATLSGAKESPPNASPATGSTAVIMDVVAHTMRIIANFSGLVGLVTAAHIHAPTATPFAGNIGIATVLPSFTGFPLGANSGTYDFTFDTTLPTSFNAAFVTANGGTAAGAEAALLAALASGRAYFNIHSNMFPAGEIRGFPVTPFTDDPLTNGVTVVQAVHVTELRQFIDAQRLRFKLTGFLWTDATLDPVVTVVKAQHILDLRLALAQAYVEADRSAPTYGDPSLAAGTTIEGSHLAEIRAAAVTLSIF